MRDSIGVARARAAAMRLSAPAAWTPARLVAWLGAVQAQEYPFAIWSIAQRLARPADVDAAFASGAILRTHILRPTWHFVARDDLRWMQALTGPRVLAQMSHYDRRNGVDAALVARSTKTIASAIERRGPLTRSEIAAALSKAGFRTSPWLVGHLVMHAELRAVVCSGAPIDGRQTYALVDERAPKPAALAGDDALAELARRYLHSHGPATAKDFQWWSGLSGAAVARAFDMLGRTITRERAGDRTYVSSARRSAVRPSRGLAQIIQTYDELVVGYSESRDVVDVSGAARAGAPGMSALLTRGVVVDGQLAARWRMPPNRGSQSIAIDPLRRLSSGERAAAKTAAARFERFYFRTSRGSH